MFSQGSLDLSCFLFGNYQVVLYKVGTSWDANLEQMASTMDMVYDSTREKESKTTKKEDTTPPYELWFPISRRLKFSLLRPTRSNTHSGICLCTRPPPSGTEVHLTQRMTRMS